MVAYNNKKFYIDIVEAKPSAAVSIIETDCEVDFAPPLDYKEPEKPAPFPLKKAPAQGFCLSTLVSYLISKDFGCCLHTLSVKYFVSLPFSVSKFSLEC